MSVSPLAPNMLTSSMLFSRQQEERLQSPSSVGRRKSFSISGDTVQFGQAAATISPATSTRDKKSTIPWWERIFGTPIPTLSKDSLWYQQQWKVMTRLHQGQTRRMGAPFFIHPLEVMILAMTLAKATREEIAAACLHDVLEDQKLRYLKALKSNMIHPNVDRLVRAATQEEIEVLPPVERDGQTLLRRQVGNVIVEADTEEKLKRKAKFVRRDQFIESVEQFPNDEFLASKLVVIGADKIVGMRAFMQEVRDEMLSHERLEGKKISAYDKFYRERFATLNYYKQLSLALWDKYDDIPSERDRERLRPLMRELTFTYFDFGQVVQELMPAHGDPHYVPSDEVLRSLLKGPAEDEIIEDDARSNPKLKEPDRIRILRPELLARIPQTH